MAAFKICPVCKSESISRYFSGEDKFCRLHSIDRCINCSHCFINPQPSLEDLAVHYKKDYQAYDVNHGMDKPDEASIEEAKTSGRFRHIPIEKGSRNLDVGCGGGYFLRVVSKLGTVAEGIELNCFGYELSKQQGLKVFNGTSSEYYRTNSSKRFDIITLNHVLEHMHDPMQELSILRGMLAKNGFIYVAVPNAGSLAFRLLKGFWHSTVIPIHLHHFTAISLRETAARAGLECREMYTYTLPRADASTLRLFLRKYLLFPGRLSIHIKTLDRVASVLSVRNDRQNKGEPLIAFLHKPRTEIY